MRFLFAALLTLILAIGLASVALRDTGYIVIGYDQWVVQTSLTLFTMILAAVFAALYFGLRFLARVTAMPQDLRQYAQTRRIHRAETALSRGLIEMAEGNWPRAEQLLSRHAAYSPMPLVHYLAAAQAAERQNAVGRRDDYLRLAQETAPKARVAVGLAQAELQLRQHEHQQALQTLAELRLLKPDHRQVLRLSIQLYSHLGEWAQVVAMLPDLRRRQVFSASEYEDLQIQAYGGQLDQAAKHPDRQELHRAWQEIPRFLRADSHLLERYVNRLIERGEDAEAEPQLRHFLRRYWDGGLVRAYGRLKGTEPEQLLAEAESWLFGRERDADLLLTLGRLSQRVQNWGKAREYFEAVLKQDPSPEIYRLLAETLDKLGDKDVAAAYSRKGLVLATTPSTGAKPKFAFDEPVAHALPVLPSSSRSL